jgi:hypothetical protein
VELDHPFKVAGVHLDRGHKHSGKMVGSQFEIVGMSRRPPCIAMNMMRELTRHRAKDDLRVACAVVRAVSTGGAAFNNKNTAATRAPVTPMGHSCPVSLRSSSSCRSPFQASK